MRVIVTGASGMVGEGVLLECLQNSAVDSVLVIGRRPCGTTHAKLKEVLHKDFFDITPIQDQLKGYDACFFCLGVSSVGMKDDEYYKMTYTLTTHVATVLSKLNPSMTFCYVSGAGTDSTEKGRLNWARVKGKTENDLMKLPFKAVYAFRPGAIVATKGQKNLLKAYKYFSWMFPIMKVVAKNSISNVDVIGRAMIRVSEKPYASKVLEVSDINKVGAA